MTIGSSFLNQARLPAPIGVDARMPGFEGVRLSISEAEESLAAAADRLTIPQDAAMARRSTSWLSRAAPWAGRSGPESWSV